VAVEEIKVGDNDSLPVFSRQIVDFRRWMKSRGQTK
jgi:hypothetical protein